MLERVRTLIQSKEKEQKVYRGRQYEGHMDSDAMVEKDLLDFDAYVNALSDVICQKQTIPPVAIGVYGAWGSGKSTFLKLVSKKIMQIERDRPYGFKEKWKHFKTEALKETEPKDKCTIGFYLAFLWHAYIWTLVKIWFQGIFLAFLVAKNEVVLFFANLFKDPREQELKWDEKIGMLKESLNSEKEKYAKIQYHSEPNVICMHFNAWSYTDSEKLWSGLIKEVCFKLDTELGFWKKLVFYWKKKPWLFLGYITFLLILVIFVWLVMHLEQSKYAFLSVLDSVGKIASLKPFTDSASKYVKETENAGTFSSLLVALLVAVLGLSPGAGKIALLKPFTDSVSKYIEETGKGLSKKVVNIVRTEMQNAIDILFFKKVLHEEKDIKIQVVEKKLKMVIFIDELDRCPLEKIVDILEAIKLFLAEEIFVVLLAIDTRVLADAIHLRYQNAENSKLAHEYIEKIIQIPIAVPAASKATLTQFVKTLMTTTEIHSRQILPHKPIEPQVPSKPFVVLPGGKKVQKILVYDTQAEKESIATFVYDYLNVNPRRAKRLINTYRFVKRLAARSGKPVDNPKWQEGMIYWLGATMAWTALLGELVYLSRNLSSDKENLDYRNRLIQFALRSKYVEGQKNAEDLVENIKNSSFIDKQCLDFLKAKILYDHARGPHSNYPPPELPNAAAYYLLKQPKKDFISNAQLAGNFIAERASAYF